MIYSDYSVVTPVAKKTVWTVPSVNLSFFSSVPSRSSASCRKLSCGYETLSSSLAPPHLVGNMANVDAHGSLARSLYSPPGDSNYTSN